MASKGTLTVRIIGDAKSFNDTLSSMGDKVSGWGKAIPKIAGAAFIGAGVALGGAMTSGFFEALGRESAQDRLAARFGLTENEAKRLGEVAAEVYTNAWGDSVGQVMAVIADLNEELGDVSSMPASEVEKLATAAIALQDVFSLETMASIDAVSQLLSTGLAGSAEEAFDIIARGLQKGANRRDDFLETLIEYSDAYRTLGLDAETATGLIIAGLDAGAFNADKLGDAINEFATLAIDGSKRTREAFELIGLDADEMARKLAEGGPVAREAMSQVIDALGDVGDTVAQDKAGVGLFGSMWEDVGKEAILALDPIHGELDNVGGTVDRVTSTAEDNIETRLKGAWRRFTNSVPEAIQDSGMLEALDRILDKFDEDGLAGAWEQVQVEWEKAWPEIEAWLGDTVVPALGRLGREAGVAFARGMLRLIDEALRGALEHLKNMPGIIRDAFDYPEWGERTALDDFLDPQSPAPSMTPVPAPDTTQSYSGDWKDNVTRGTSVFSPTVNVFNPEPRPATTVTTDLRRLAMEFG